MAGKRSWKGKSRQSCLTFWKWRIIDPLMYQRLAWHKHSNNPQKKYQSTPITKSICSHPHPHIHDLLCAIIIFSQLSPCASWTSTPTSSSSIPFRSSKPYTYSAPKVASELSEHSARYSSAWQAITSAITIIPTNSGSGTGMPQGQYYFPWEPRVYKQCLPALGRATTHTRQARQLIFDTLSQLKARRNIHPLWI